MFSKPRVPGRVQELVGAVRQAVNLPGTTEEFENYNKKLSHYLASGLAESTAESYFNSFTRFSKFCVQNNVPVLPTSTEVFMTFLVKIVEESGSIAAAKSMRSAIRHYNILHRPDLPSPTDREDVSLLIKSFERKYGGPVQKKDPTTPDILKKLIDIVLAGDQCKFYGFSKPLEDWQMVVKTVLKFHTFARFEEVVELRVSNFDFLPSGDIEVTFLKSKNNQFHDARKSTISALSGSNYCPVNIVKKYISVMKFPQFSDSYFLPKFEKGKPQFGRKTSYLYCVSRFKAGLAKIGVDPRNFGEHSDRIGGLSAAANAGCSLTDLQTHGRWKSASTPQLYHKKSLVLKKKVSSTLNEL